jgi:hypothetical protein
VDLIAACRFLKSDVRIVDRLARKLNFEIGVDVSGIRRVLRQGGAHDHHGELRAANDLDHMQIAIGVSGLKALDGRGDEEIALAAGAGSLSASLGAAAVHLVHGVGHVVSEGGADEDVLRLSARGNASESDQRKSENATDHSGSSAERGFSINADAA